MSEREDELKSRVRETPLLERLEDCRKRMANMCSERRGPRMSIPVDYRDDDFHICTTVQDARVELDGMRERIKFLEKKSGNLLESSNMVLKVKADQDERIADLKAHLIEADNARKHAQQEGTKLVEKVRSLEAQLKGETIQSVTEWANSTFGPATLERQVMRALEEIGELQEALRAGDAQKIAIEAADACICLYRVIGTIDPEAINKKMAKNRARTWKLDGHGCARHVKEDPE